ncbi:MAG: corrinoid protein [Chloroflexota bacterium]|nr:corrinoid protein [Chloroflexota bacterium]
METLSMLSQSLIDGDAQKVKELTQKALEQGISPEDILSQGLTPAMDVVGERFSNGEYFLPEVLFSARAMKAAMEVLEPIGESRRVPPRARMVLGSVKGDVHDIGKNLVAIMMRGAGFEVIDLGTDVPPEKFVEAVERTGAELVGMSALTSATMLFMKSTIEALVKAELRNRVKIMVGGAIVRPAYAQSIGADGYAPNAVSAVAKARELLRLA